MTCRCAERTTAEAPAAGSAWPRWLLAAPRSSGAVRATPPASTAASAPTSIGSPSGVPVPCSSTHCRALGDAPASAQAARITCTAPVMSCKAPTLFPSHAGRCCCAVLIRVDLDDCLRPCLLPGCIALLYSLTKIVMKSEKSAKSGAVAFWQIHACCCEGP